MLQSSITAWLKKPASVTKVDSSAASSSALPVLRTPSTAPPPAVIETVSPAAVQNSRAQSARDTSNIQQLFSLRPLPKNVELVPLTEDLIPSFKRLNSLLLPIAYPAAFYTETMTEPHHSVTLIALWHVEPLEGSISPTPDKPKVVGAIRCRVLQNANLYISTIGLLSPYRSHGIASHLLHRIAVKATKEFGVRCITAHVWEANEEGLEWYKKRGFEIVGQEDGYYRKLNPSGAYLVRKWIKVGDLLGE